MKSKYINVGDVVKIYEDQSLPCDVVLLASSNEQGKCYLTTANLDGETNLKVSRAFSSKLQWNRCVPCSKWRWLHYWIITSWKPDRNWCKICPLRNNWISWGRTSNVNNPRWICTNSSALWRCMEVKTVPWPPTWAWKIYYHVGADWRILLLSTVKTSLLLIDSFSHVCVFKRNNLTAETD